MRNDYVILSLSKNPNLDESGTHEVGKFYSSGPDDAGSQHVATTALEFLSRHELDSSTGSE